jgi:hypothetical protein
VIWYLFLRRDLFEIIREWITVGKRGPMRLAVVEVVDSGLDLGLLLQVHLISTLLDYFSHSTWLDFQSTDL